MGTKMCDIDILFMITFTCWLLAVVFFGPLFLFTCIADFHHIVLWLVKNTMQNMKYSLNWGQERSEIVFFESIFPCSNFLLIFVILLSNKKQILMGTGNV